MVASLSDTHGQQWRLNSLCLVQSVDLSLGAISWDIGNYRVPQLFPWIYVWVQHWYGSPPSASQAAHQPSPPASFPFYLSCQGQVFQRQQPKNLVCLTLTSWISFLSPSAFRNLLILHKKYTSQLSNLSQNQCRCSWFNSVYQYRVNMQGSLATVC